MELSDPRDTRMLETQRAFDSVAPTYDGPRGNNALIQRMRDIMWRKLEAAFPGGSHVLDLGCGTGLDAVHLAQRGYSVTATDWSPEMVRRTHDRARDMNVSSRVAARHIGAQDLSQLVGEGACFDGAYSNFGPLNCVPGLQHTASQLTQLIKPGGQMIFTVIGRICPWELLHYIGNGNFKRARVRFRRDITAVNLNKHTVWTRYYTPREFYRPFREGFELTHYEAFSLFVPPPYLTWLHDRHPAFFNACAMLDNQAGAWPLLRDMGDHFLIVLTRK
jgi:SAM-dependent methyltransferase